MQAPYRPVLSAPLRPETPNNMAIGPGAGVDDQRPLKGRRVSVRVACNGCRAKKAACDGRRPQCTRCIEQRVVCEYISKNEEETVSMAIKRELEHLRKELKQHTDILDHLRTASEEDALNTIRRLRSTPSVSAVLTSIRNKMLSKQPSNARTARAILSTSTSAIEFELTMLHSLVYPALPAIEIASINLDKLPQNSAHPSHKRIPDALTTGQDAMAGVIESGVIDPDILATEPPSPLRGVSGRRIGPIAGPLPAPQYCDTRLSQLSVGYWTTIPISDEFAASAISAYLEYEHAAMGFFEADLFLTDLVDHNLEHCSSFLASAILCLACQCYAGFDHRASPLSLVFLREAENLWRADRHSDGVTTLAAMLTLCAACTWQGEEGLALELLQNVRLMAEHMNLLGVFHTREVVDGFRQLSPKRIKATSHTAWGCYCWLRYWTIVQEVQAVYLARDILPLYEKVPLAFAEAKFQKLLSWTDTLGKDMSREEYSQIHVANFHALFHIAVLNIFRPFLQRSEDQQMESFSSPDSSPGAVYNASLKQLQRLVLEYRIRYPTRLYCPIFSAGVLHVASNILNDKLSPDWRFYFLLCIGFWKEAFVRHACMGQLAAANLCLGMSSGSVNGAEARMIMDELQHRSEFHKLAEITVSCIVDFDRAMYAGNDIRAHELVKKFDDLALFDELTKGEYESHQNVDLEDDDD